MSILFLDIETVPLYKTLAEAHPAHIAFWKEKCRYLPAFPDKTADELYDRAGIYAEFGKVIVVSLGYYTISGNNQQLKIKSFAGDNEFDLLTQLSKTLAKLNPQNTRISGHNIKEFDIPYLCRRMIIHQIRIPDCIQVIGKKPWETPFIDTLELWKFGDYKHYTKLALLAEILDIPTSKDDIDGSAVSRVYYDQKDLKRITTYCEKDVILSCRLYQRITGIDLIDDQEIIFSD